MSTVFYPLRFILIVAKYLIKVVSLHGSYTSLDLQIIVKMSKNAKLTILQLQAAAFAPC